MLNIVPWILMTVILVGCTPEPTVQTTAQTQNGGSTQYDVPEEDADPVRPAAVQAELDEIRKVLDTIALDLACGVGENCIALGADDNACGIPTDWLIFSTQAPRYIEVEALLRRSFYLDNTYPNSRFQDCGGPSQPLLRCIEGQCQKIPFPP